MCLDENYSFGVNFCIKVKELDYKRKKECKHLHSFCMFVKNGNDMIKDWKQIDLSKATIFDLTDDENLIRKAECIREPGEIPDKIIYETEYPREYIVTSMLSLAEIIDDEPLYRAILKANPDYEPVPCCIVGASKFDHRV